MSVVTSVFAANIRFEQVGQDYFQQDLPPSPIQHYWSLSIEEQFYFVWPLLLFGIFLATRKLYRRGHTWARHWGLLGSMALVVAASFAWAMYLTAANPNGAYFSTFTRVWELGIGALVAILGPWLVRIPHRIRPGLAYLGLGGVVASLFLIQPASAFPAPWAALPVLSTAVVAASFYGAEVRYMGVLTNPFAQWFGDTSYTLYLWHWPVIYLLLAVFPKGPLFYCTALAVSLGLTALTYYFYENPLRRSKWLLERESGRSLQLEPSSWAAIGAVAAAVAVLGIIYIERGERLEADRIEAEAAVVVSLAPPVLSGVSDEGDTPALSVVPGNGPCFGAPAMVNTSCELRDPNVPLQPSIETFATEFAGPSCFTPGNEPLKSCTYGYQGADATRIALVGDSHAGRALQALAPYLEGEKWHLTTFIGKGCKWNGTDREFCAAMPDIERALLTERFDLVVTTSTVGGSPEGYVSVWRPVVAAGSRIVVLIDNPKASEESISCLTRVGGGEDRSGECGTPRDEAVRSDPQTVAAYRVDPPAHIIDLTPYYCTADFCPSVIGDTIVYADTSSHVTPTFWRTLAPAFINGIRQALN